MNRPDYQIRLMQRHELDTVLAWAAEEGWNPGLHDAHCFYSADPEGFLIGLLDGQPIASISVVRYGADYSFLGLYIVRPEHRGHGYGLRIWNAGLAQLGARAIGLDGVVAQQYNYRRSGFELAHRNIRFQGGGGGKPKSFNPSERRQSVTAPVRGNHAVRSRVFSCWTRHVSASLVKSTRWACVGIAGVRGFNRVWRDPSMSCRLQDRPPFCQSLGGRWNPFRGLDAEGCCRQRGISGCTRNERCRAQIGEKFGHDAHV